MWQAVNVAHNILHFSLVAPGSSFSHDAEQATFYPNAYPDCASGGAGGQKYGLPDLGSLAPDPTLPNRCQDPDALQASMPFFSAGCGLASGFDRCPRLRPDCKAGKGPE